VGSVTGSSTTREPARWHADSSAGTDGSLHYSRCVAETNDLAALGRLLAAPARAAMVDALFDGRAWTVAELAEAAGVSPSTASEHLQALAQGGLVSGTREGRNRRYRIASDAIAVALESLSTLAPLRPANGLRAVTRTEAMWAARTCYDHLAGRLGVAVADGLVQAGVLQPAEQSFAPTAGGAQALGVVGIDLDELSRMRRPATLACLDWSEQRPHLGGALGAALLRRLESTGGIERLTPGRAVRLQPSGRALLGSLGITIDAG
jgi:DNA-binding transcriptional ArsR family regulator